MTCDKSSMTSRCIARCCWIWWWRLRAMIFWRTETTKDRPTDSRFLWVNNWTNHVVARKWPWQKVSYEVSLFYATIESLTPSRGLPILVLWRRSCVNQGYIFYNSLTPWPDRRLEVLHTFESERNDETTVESDGDEKPFRCCDCERIADANVS